MPFYKMQEGQNEFYFQLANLQVREDFSLWDNATKRFIRQLPDVADISDLRFMKQDLFKQRYPTMQKKSQYIRDLAITLNGIPAVYSFGFVKTANDQINAEIGNLQKLGRDPLAYNFKYRKTGSGLATTHVVVVMQEVGKPNLPEAQATPNKPNIMQAMAQGLSANKEALNPLKLTLQPVLVGLSKEEQQVLDLFNQEPAVFGEEQFVAMWLSTWAKYFQAQHGAMMPDRIKEIYKLNYTKHA